MTEMKTAGLFFTIFFLLDGFVAALNCSGPTPESLIHALEKELIPKRLLRPVKAFSETLNIYIYITLVGILGVNEKAQSLTTTMWLILQWDIDGLSWDEKECGTQRISVPRQMIWVPDVHISELMDEDKSPKTPYVYISNTGRVTDDKPLRVISSCQLEIYTFPFDVQNCSLTFGSYLHFAQDIRMVQAAQILKESKHVLQTKGEWELADIQVSTTTLEITVASYSEIKYFITLKRRSTLYMVNLLLPSFFLITIDLFSFMLPPQSVDRSSFKMTLILGYTVFLLIMNELLPITGSATPVINVVFSIKLSLMVASLLEMIFISNIQFRSSLYNAVPHWLSVLVLRYLSVIVFLPPKKKGNRVTVFLHPPPATDMNTTVISWRDLQSSSGGTPPEKSALDELRKLSRDLTAIRLQMDNHFHKSKIAQEWQMLGVVIDRFLFGLYLIFITFSFVSIIYIWYFRDYSA